MSDTVKVIIQAEATVKFKKNSTDGKGRLR